VPSKWPDPIQIGPQLSTTILANRRKAKLKSKSTVDLSYTLYA